jgi:uncharacterized protein (UPF0254 family)
MGVGVGVDVSVGTTVGVGVGAGVGVVQPAATLRTNKIARIMKSERLRFMVDLP